MVVACTQCGGTGWFRPHVEGFANSVPCTNCVGPRLAGKPMPQPTDTAALIAEAREMAADKDMYLNAHGAAIDLFERLADALEKCEAERVSLEDELRDLNYERWESR